MKQPKASRKHTTPARKLPMGDPQHLKVGGLTEKQNNDGDPNEE